MGRASARVGAWMVALSLFAVAGSTLPGALAGAASAMPGAPTIISVAPGERRAIVKFKGPADPKGQIVGYRGTCTAVAGGANGASVRQQSPIVVGHLTGGRRYTCQVAAQTRAGTGPFSAPSPVVVPTDAPANQLPDPPSVVHATAAVAAVEVRFNRLARSGGQMVTRYRARCTSTTDGKQHYAREESRPPIIVRHLLEATAYTCKVAARNPSGWSVYSKASNQVVTKTRRPGAPVITSVTPGARSLQVAFGPPANHGGASITAYRVTCTSSDGGVSGSKAGAHSPLTVIGLPAKTYQCRMTATNSYGTGPASAPSKPVTVSAS